MLTIAVRVRPISMARSAKVAQERGRRHHAQHQAGDLGAALQWSSSIDGTIGSGESFTTSSLSQGIHVITASATDSHGEEGSATVTTIRLPEPGSEGLLAGLVGLAALARRRSGRRGSHQR